MEYSVHKRENAYFVAKVIGTVLVWLAIFWYCSRLGSNVMAISTITVVVVYAAMIALFVFIQKVFIVAYMKGEGICVSENQFAGVFRQYVAMAEKLGIAKVPPLFILQQGGALNAFAIRFSRKNYVAIYSDIFALYEKDPDALNFVLGHELGHVKRAHMSKRFWTLPADFIPFLGPAYSRACEYTCDNIGSSLAAGGKTNGLALLAGGTELYTKIDLAQYIEGARLNRTASVNFCGLFISHPYLPARIENVRNVN